MTRDEWYEKLPANEKDMPYFRRGSKMITPREHRDSNRRIRASVLDDEELIDIDSMSESELDDLVVLRTSISVNRARKEKTIVPMFAIFGELPIPLSNIAPEIRKHSKIGNEFRNMQIAYIKKQLSKLEV